MSKYLVLLMIVGVATAVQKVPVKLYYETLCADSMKFFTKQFTPTWQELSQYIEITFVPFGKSQSSPAVPPSNQPNWTCHHGPNECVGNKLQSCIIDSESGISVGDQIPYLDCLMTEAKIPVEYEVTARETCCTKLDVKLINKAIDCSKNDKGNTLLRANEEKTKALVPPLKSVPTIVFNNKYVQAESEASLTSFKGELCKHITAKPVPKPCENVNGASSTAAGVITLLTATALLFNQL